MKHRHAITLVELLVVIAIIGVLMGLLLPSMQSARESARQIGCRNNLKQLGLAALNYEHVNGRLPGHHYPYELQVLINAGAKMTYAATTPCFLWLLPFAEERQIYDSCLEIIKNNGSVMSAPFAKQIVTFRCPSERFQGLGPLGIATINYRANRGDISTPSYNKCRGVFSPGSTWSGVSPNVKTSNTATALAQIIDGLSNTLLFSEAVIGDRATLRSLPAGVGKYGSTIDASTPPAACWGLVSGNQYVAIPTDTGFPPGGAWASTADSNTAFYTHAAPNTPRCVNDYDWGYVVMPASSYHPGGVFAAMCDGSVRFVSDGVDAGDPTQQQYNDQGAPNYAGAWIYSKASIRGVWGALSTIKGREAVPPE